MKKLSILILSFSFLLNVKAETSFKDNELFRAIQENKLKRFNFLLRRGINPNLKDENGKSLVHLSLEKKDKGFFKSLIKSGADVNVRDQEKNTPLHLVVTKSSLSLIRLLVKAGVDPNLQNEKGQTALHLVSATGRRFVNAKLLLEAKADPNIQDKRKKTALHYAILNEESKLGPFDQSVAYLLVKSGADLKLVDENGKTALMLALSVQRVRLAQFLIEAGAEKSSFENFVKEEFGESFLNKLPKSTEAQFKEIEKEIKRLAQMKGVYTKAKVSFKDKDPFKAMEENNLIKFKALFKKGVSPNLKDESGNSLIHLSIKKNNINFFKALIENKADLNIRDAKKNTPLHLASLMEKEHFTRFLAEAGADPNLKNEKGQTALHLASIEGGKISYVRALLKAGADLNIQDHEGKSPLHYAILNKDNRSREVKRSIAHLLVKSGADLNLVDKNGKTALREALNMQRINLSKLLIKKGAKKSSLENFVKEEFGESFLNKLPKSTEDQFKEIKKEIKRIIQVRGVDTRIKNSIKVEHLFKAMEENKLIKFKTLLKRGADLNLTDEKENSLLHISIQEGKKSFFKALIKNKADLNIRDAKKNTPLHLASLKEDKYYTKKLIEAGADPNLQNEKGQSPLHLASSSGNHIEPVKTLLKAGAYINTQDHEGKTPLHYTILNRQNEILIFLLKNKADPSIKDNDGFDPIHKASRSKYFVEKLEVFYKYSLSELDKKTLSFSDFQNMEVQKGQEMKISRLNKGLLFKAMEEGNLVEFKELLLKGSNPNETDENKASLLHHSIEKGKRNFFHLLIGADADVNRLDMEENSPLHWAVLESDSYYTEQLIEYGADPNLRNEIGKTPLHFASSLKQTNLNHMRALLNAAAKINLEDEKGKTALHYAVMFKNINKINFLIQNGADVNAKDLKDMSPLHELAEIRLHNKMAESESLSDIAKTLIKNGADLNATDLLGQTPLIKAVKSNNFILSKQLIHEGTDLFIRDHSGKSLSDYALNSSLDIRDLILGRVNNTKSPLKPPRVIRSNVRLVRR